MRNGNVSFYVTASLIYSIGFTCSRFTFNGALLVIPALSARLLAHSPRQMVIWAFVLAQLGVSVGLWSSAALNISTGLSIVLCMALSFALIFMLQKSKSNSSGLNQAA